MSEQTTLVEIYWPYSHDRGDDNIEYQLEAGGDEGPLLVIPARRRTKPGSPTAIGVFKNVDWYLSSLAFNDDADVSRERWVGLVRGSDRANGDAAVAALQRLAHNLSTTRKVRLGPLGHRGKTVSSVPEGALTELIAFDGSIMIKNDGEGFKDVARVYPALLSEMSV